jgi:hypothetical protein
VLAEDGAEEGRARAAEVNLVAANERAHGAAGRPARHLRCEQLGELEHVRRHVGHLLDLAAQRGLHLRARRRAHDLHSAEGAARRVLGDDVREARRVRRRLHARGLGGRAHALLLAEGGEEVGQRADGRGDAARHERLERPAAKRELALAALGVVGEAESEEIHAAARHARRRGHDLRRRRGVQLARRDACHHLAVQRVEVSDAGGHGRRARQAAGGHVGARVRLELLERGKAERAREVRQLGVNGGEDGGKALRGERALG